MGQFQQLMKAALLSGAIAGSLLFVYQYLVMVPRIIAAEVYEEKAEAAAAAGDDHEHDEWKPREGFERNFLTAASTVLTGIGFAALLLSVVSLSGVPLDVRRGLLWGLAGFACFTLTPSLGLPPEPPGVPVADVGARQLWWAATAGATGIALFLMSRYRRGWIFPMLGAIFLLLPHAIGAPKAVGPEIVPARLVNEFAIASIAGNGLFWVILGSAAGFFAGDRKGTETQPIVASDAAGS